MGLKKEFRTVCLRCGELSEKRVCAYCATCDLRDMEEMGVGAAARWQFRTVLPHAHCGATSLDRRLRDGAQMRDMDLT